MNLPLLLENFFNPLENCESTTFHFFKSLGINITKSTVRKNIEEHPNYPSLLCISDVLNNYGVENISVKIDSNKLSELSTPFIVQIKDPSTRQDLFTVVREINVSKTNYLNAKGDFESIDTDFFYKHYNGIVLLADAKSDAGDHEYHSHLIEEKRRKFTNAISILAIPLLTVLATWFCYLKYGNDSALPIVFTYLTLFGTITAGLLLWFEIDEHNPALQQICSSGRKVNCGAILNSKASKIWGISWSTIGFTYFFGSLISLLVTGIYHVSVLTILSWLNVAALPYIVFSIYYQAKIAKQWCLLCLFVQAILGLQFAIAAIGRFHYSTRLDITSGTLVTVLIAFLIPFLIASVLLPSLRKAKESRQVKIDLQRLKHNSQVFDAILAKQKILEEPTDGLGIYLGSPKAQHKLVKVCNPHCGPCAKAHPVMEELLKNNPNIQMQIIFTANGGDNDLNTPLVKHLLAIAEKNDEELTKEALDTWYLADKKEYSDFAAKYPMNGELKMQDEKIKLMHDWCEKTKINSTPKFFLNGHQLPDIYSVSDLKYFLLI